MIGLDTNVLVRYIVRDDPKQTAVATELIEKRCTPENPGWINLIVACEVTWVLKSVYGRPREDIAGVIETILTSNELNVESADALWQALRKFRSGSADIADYLIGATNSLHDAAPTFTFDRKVSADPDFHFLTT